MTNLIEEFQKRRNLLQNLNFADSKHRLTGFLSWMESREEINAILKKIETSVDANSILAETSYSSPPLANSPDEITATGLAFLKMCRGGQEPFSLAADHGVSPSYDTNRVQAYLDELLARFLEPLFDDIEERLMDFSNTKTPDDLIAREVTKSISSDLSTSFPQTAYQLQKISDKFSSNNGQEDWFNVGNSCREALKIFAQELKLMGIVEISKETKEGDVKGIVQEFIEKMPKSSRFERTLKKLISTVWDHCQSITHRKNTSRKEAFRVFTWTVLTLSEIHAQIDEMGQ